MKPVKTLEADYLFAGRLDARERRAAVGLNLTGLALLFFFGWLFLQLSVALRSELQSADLRAILDGMNLLGTLIGLAGVLVIHELIHGLFFWIFTKEKPEFGVHLLFAYAAAPGWYLPRNQFLVIGLAPLLLISFVGLLLMPLIPFTMVAPLYLALTFNAAGSVGDLAVAGWLLSQPGTIRVHDGGPDMTFYRSAPSEIAPMSRRWLSLMDQFGVKDEKARRAFATLVQSYTEPGRYYHNLEHIETLLDTVDQLQNLAQNYPAIQLAVWYHDVIYDPRSKENERKSAEFAQKALTELEIPPNITRRVVELILLTTDHQAPDGDIDGQILLDADLAPLGADKEEFERQSNELKKEFSWVPVDEFKANRRRLLSSFVERDRIYQTDPLFQSLEQNARRNIAWVLESEF